MSGTVASGSLRASVFWHDGHGTAQLRDVWLPAGATLADAVRASGLEPAFGGARWQGDGATLRLAVFGSLRDPASALRDGDRVDVTRALRVDPKEARRLRARASKAPGAPARRRRAAKPASSG